ncbi:UDP-2,3-diacylglucosamine diphosphatase [Thiohalospira sp.]|uniref:UDP-2,3-diacylglucosamine diphosphatase n=1 Tax=Thiohalospira sp. TaxID=3080549 RepID=UPI00397EB62A
MDHTVPNPVRTLFLSDVHLGTPDARAEELLAFLEGVECETIYLVGDIIDLHAMRRRGTTWPESHDAVLRHLFRRARAGVEVVFIPGNHDESFRDLAGTALGRIRVAQEAVHTTADGRRMLVTHGDELDSAVCCNRLVSIAGDAGYALLLALNRATNRVRRRLGWPYWSLAGHIKSRLGRAQEYIRRFEDAALHLARERGFDGVICGHIHQARLRREGQGIYANDGDWVESCTALVEEPDGSLRLVDGQPVNVVRLPVRPAA